MKALSWAVLLGSLLWGVLAVVFWTKAHAMQSATSSNLNAGILGDDGVVTGAVPGVAAVPGSPLLAFSGFMSGVTCRFYTSGSYDVYTAAARVPGQCSTYTGTTYVNDTAVGLLCPMSEALLYAQKRTRALVWEPSTAGQLRLGAAMDAADGEVNFTKTVSINNPGLGTANYPQYRVACSQNGSYCQCDIPHVVDVAGTGRQRRGVAAIPAVTGTVTGTSGVKEVRGVLEDFSLKIFLPMLILILGLQLAAKFYRRVALGPSETTTTVTTVTGKKRG